SRAPPAGVLGVLLAAALGRPPRGRAYPERPRASIRRTTGAGALRRRPDGKINDHAYRVAERRAPEPCAGAPTAKSMTTRIESPNVGRRSPAQAPRRGIQ